MENRITELQLAAILKSLDITETDVIICDPKETIEKACSIEQKEGDRMFWTNFYNLCMSVETSPNAVCKELGFSNAASTHWKNGTTPNGDAIVAIADYFGCSTDYLLGRTDNPNFENAVVSSEKKVSRQSIQVVIDQLEEIKNSIDN